MSPAGDYARSLLRKAREDQYVVGRLAPEDESPAWIVGFHAQQAVEKALKAVLASRRLEHPRTHNLAMLVELLRRAGLGTPPDGDDLGRLSPFGVAFRYEDAGEDEVDLDRSWAVAASQRTVEWAEERVEASDEQAG